MHVQMEMHVHVGVCTCVALVHVATGQVLIRCEVGFDSVRICGILMRLFVT